MMPNVSTPYPTSGKSDPKAPEYRDEGAVELYNESGASKLVGAARKLHTSMDRQSQVLEQYFNTPFTEENAKRLEATIAAIERVELLLERWHFLIYPNQKPEIRDADD